LGANSSQAAARAKPPKTTTPRRPPWSAPSQGAVASSRTSGKTGLPSRHRAYAPARTATRHAQSAAASGRLPGPAAHNARAASGWSATRTTLAAMPETGRRRRSPPGRRTPRPAPAAPRSPRRRRAAPRRPAPSGRRAAAGTGAGRGRRPGARAGRRTGAGSSWAPVPAAARATGGGGAARGAPAGPFAAEGRGGRPTGILRQHGRHARLAHASHTLWRSFG
jgi:hypothetical protein